MPVSDSAKLDYLWKKVGYGVTKTAPPDNKEAFNESIPSPLIYRGDLVMVDSGDIPAVIPTADTAIIEIYKDNSVGNSWSATVECTEDLTAPDNRTWKTNLQNWVPPQFGSTYLVKVYVANASVSNPQTVGTQLFQAGSGNNDEWFFDYQSGVLNFNGANIPSIIGTGVTGKSVYISGARYVGEFGVTGGAALGNLVIANTTITTDGTIADIVIEPYTNGDVIIDTTTSLVVPVGNTSQRPGSPSTGAIRFNTVSQVLEIWDGSQWDDVGSGLSAITNQTITGDNSTDTFTLDQTTTATSIIVSTNGVLQAPNVAYTVSGDQITFAEPPLSTDVIEVRFIATLNVVNTITNSSGNAKVEVSDAAANVDVTGSMNVNGNFLRVPQYANTTVRDATITSPAAGMIVLTGNIFQGYNGSGWVDFN